MQTKITFVGYYNYANYWALHLLRIPEDGEYRTQWTFASDDDITKWVTTADSEWGEGYSNCALELRENGRAAIFHGDLNTVPPNDGRKDEHFCTIV